MKPDSWQQCPFDVLEQFLSLDNIELDYDPYESHNEYGDEPEWIGTIERSEEDGDRWFNMYGDNRTLSVAELQQILDFLSKNFEKSC